MGSTGLVTPLQRLGAAAYLSGRFSGVVTPSRFDDVVSSYCFNFLPSEVKPRLQDAEEVMKRIHLLESFGIRLDANLGERACIRVSR